MTTFDPEQAPTLTAFGIDPELVAAPQPAGAGPLNLQAPVTVPVFRADAGADGDADAADSAAGTVADAATVTAADADATGDDGEPAKESAASAETGELGAGDPEASETEAPAEEPHPVTAEATTLAAPAALAATPGEPEPEPAGDESPVHLDERAPSATASAANAAESATAAELPRGMGRKRTRTKLPKAPNPRTRRVPKSRVAEARSERNKAAFARTVGIIGAAGIVASSVWVLGWMPLPEQHAQAPVATITPKPGEQVRVCPGPLQQLGLTSKADAISSVGSAKIHEAAEAPGAPKVTELGAEGPVAYSVPGMNGDTHSQLGVSQSVEATGKKSSGFSVTSCSQPVPSQWLLAGNTVAGHNSVLDVINPGKAPARVNFALYTEKGPVRPTIPEAVLQPGERKQVSLAGVAADAGAIAVRVEATGTPVVAYVHQTAIDSLEPKGSDIASATALPATRQVIAGMHVFARPVQDDDAPTTLGTVVRMMNPGDTDLNATITFISASGERTTHEVPLTAGRVVDMPITTLPEGEYTIVVDADAPILASGRMAPLDGGEFAWIASSPEINGKTMVSIAEGPNPKLALANPSDADRTLKVNGKDVRVRAGATVYMDEPSGADVTLDNAEGIYAAVYYSGSGAISGMPVLSGNPDATPIQVVR